MQTITSGSSNERLLRAAVLMLLVDGFALLFLWDGHVGYAKKNAAELAGLLGLAQLSAPAPDMALTAELGRQIAADIRPGEPTDAAIGRLGTPALMKDDDLYYLGRGGWVQVNAESGRVQGAVWKDAKHTDADQKWQRWIGYALAVIGVAATVHFGLVMATRAEVSDEGVRLNGYSRIPWDGIKGLRSVPGHTGTVELEFVSNGEADRVRLDDYRYKELESIAAAIAQRKGFANPLAMDVAV